MHIIKMLRNFGLDKLLTVWKVISFCGNLEDNAGKSAD